MQGLPPVSSSRGLPLPLESLVRLAPVQAWLLVLLSLDVAIVGDRLSGPDVWFGPAYLLVICLATWSLGWAAGQAVALGCLAATLAINGATLYPAGAVDLTSNLALRLFAISTIIAVIAGSRRAFIREWWLARTDPLTGALNRQAFFELSAPLTTLDRWRLMIYVDLDGLKRINDARGHAAGDDALKTYAHRARRSIRRDDLFARVGGDEFVIFMPVKDEEAARAVAARLHRQMNGGLDAEGQPVLCSLGALIVEPGPVEIDAIVRHADNLMYQAKMRGACLEIDSTHSGAPRPVAGHARRWQRPRYTPPLTRTASRVDRRERRPTT